MSDNNKISTDKLDQLIQQKTDETEALKRLIQELEKKSSEVDKQQPGKKKNK